MKKIKRWIRKKYVMWKYKHNWNTGKVVILSDGDRGYGLTTMMLKDCIKNDYVLFVPFEADKKSLFKSVEDRKEYDKFILTKMDVKMGAHVDRNIRGVIMDNHCSYADIKFLCDNELAIVNGFIHMGIAA